MWPPPPSRACWSRCASRTSTSSCSAERATSRYSRARPRRPKPKRARRAHAAVRFDALAAALVPDAAGERAERRAAAHHRAARRAERDGLDARLAMLELRRGDILHGDDDRALQAEYDALLAV